MRDIEKHCRWSNAALAARPLFTTPEIRELWRLIESKIEEFFVFGEGYPPTIINLKRFDCDFVLVYSFEERLWIFDVIGIPPTGPRGDGPNVRGRLIDGYERVHVEFFDKLAPIWRDWLGAASALLYNIAMQVGPSIADFCGNAATRKREFAALRSNITALVRRLTPPADANLPKAEQASHACDQVVELVQNPFGGLLTFLGLMWAWERPIWRPEQEDLWDSALFGQLQEASM